MPNSDEMRLDELARRAGVATTTVRLYQNKGLLPGPRLVGRTGFYDASHLARLELIGRLQEQGFSLAGIGRLLDTWEHGRDLHDLVGVERELDALLGRRHEVVLDAADLVARFPPGSLSPELIQRAASMGLVEATDDGRFRLPDDRFLHTGAALIDLGVPPHVVLDEWAYLTQVTDGIADRFVSVFEDHLLPDDWRRDLTGATACDLARTLEQLRDTAREVVLASFDTSMARAASRRLGELVATATAADG